MDVVCIVCPISCRIVIIEDSSGQLNVSGNVCKRGHSHACNEYRNPQRMLTSTVSVENGFLPRIPVISTKEIPKDKIINCFNALYSIKLKAPISDGQVVLRNICDTGVDIITSRAMKPAGKV